MEQNFGSYCVFVNNTKSPIGYAQRTLPGFFPFQVNLAVIHGYLGNEQEARKSLGRMFALWSDAAQNMLEILDFWFPFEDLAEVFTKGLMKAGFSAGN